MTKHIGKSRTVREQLQELGMVMLLHIWNLLSLSTEETQDQKQLEISGRSMSLAPAFGKKWTQDLKILLQEFIMLQVSAEQELPMAWWSSLGEEVKMELLSMILGDWENIEMVDLTGCELPIEITQDQTKDINTEVCSWELCYW